MRRGFLTEFPGQFCESLGLGDVGNISEIPEGVGIAERIISGDLPDDEGGDKWLGDAG